MAVHPSSPIAEAGNVARPRRILVINAKGGCGKTTLATNLASYYAAQGLATVLADHDPQGSSMQWLTLRGEEQPKIHGIAAQRPVTGGATRSWLLRPPPGSERVILDAPAGVHGQQLIELMREVDTLLIPVLPSPIDIHAASQFIRELLLVARVRARNIRVGVVANRVRENTLVYQALERFLASLQIPFAGRLRDTQNYVHAAAAGIGIHDLKRRNEADREQWESLLRWLDTQ